jgi:hypothetical protein
LFTPIEACGHRSSLAEYLLGLLRPLLPAPASAWPPEPLWRSLLGRRPDQPPPPDAATLDTLLSLWKIEGRPPTPEAAAVLAEFGALLVARGAIDFDDLVVRACELLETDPSLRERWQGRFSHLLVDEFQDVDAAQLRLVRILAEPERNLVVVGDDDQTIYAWRLADVILSDLQQYECPGRPQANEGSAGTLVPVWGTTVRQASWCIG